MIPRDYINFYKNWYYKKTDNKYEARESGDLGITNVIEKTDLSDFVKKLSKKTVWEDSCDNIKDFNVITKKYPWIKTYYKEIVFFYIRKAVIISLFITAIKVNDEMLCDYILKNYSLTKDDSLAWKLNVLDGYNKVAFSYAQYGEKYYLLQSNEKFSYYPNLIPYRKGNKYTVVYGRRYILSDTLKKQLNEAESLFKSQLKDALAEVNGYSLADFTNGRIIAFKHLSCDKYHFFVIKKSKGKLTRIESITSSAIQFISDFNFDQWGFIGKKSKIELDNFPLFNRVKDVKDVFLEYEIKYLLGVATQEEMDYLNANDSEDGESRFNLKKEIYDIDDVCIIEVSSHIERWYRRVNEVRLVIDGKERKAKFDHYADGSDLLQVYSLYKSLECNITERLANRIKELLKEKIKNNVLYT